MKITIKNEKFQREKMTIFIALALGDGMAQMAGVCGEGVNLTVYTLYTTVFIYCIGLNLTG